MTNESDTKQERRIKIGDIIFIILLLLGPGIRGYDNWMLHEYLFILTIIGSIIYSWITGNRFWQMKAETPEEEA